MREKSLNEICFGAIPVYPKEIRPVEIAQKTELTITQVMSAIGSLPANAPICEDGNGRSIWYSFVSNKKKTLFMQTLRRRAG